MFPTLGPALPAPCPSHCTHLPPTHFGLGLCDGTCCCHHPGHLRLLRRYCACHTFSVHYDLLTHSTSLPFASLPTYCFSLCFVTGLLSSSCAALTTKHTVACHALGRAALRRGQLSHHAYSRPFLYGACCTVAGQKAWKRAAALALLSALHHGAGLVCAFMPAASLPILTCARCCAWDGCIAGIHCLFCTSLVYMPVSFYFFLLPSLNLCNRQTFLSVLCCIYVNNCSMQAVFLGLLLLGITLSHCLPPTSRLAVLHVLLLF
jgi:hypothetical protein